MVSAIVDGMRKDPSTCNAAMRNLMELDATTVFWRIGAIGAFVLAFMAALLSASCGSVWIVFFGVFFTALCVSYARTGHERGHVSGPIYAALRVASRLQSGERPEDIADRQL